MQRIRSISVVILIAIIFGIAASMAGASILAGPVTNPDNGHKYYLLNQSSWTAGEAESLTLGGHLATVRNLVENTFIFNTFAASVPQAPQHRWLWIGLSRVPRGSTQWAWSSGEPFSYSNWDPTQPDNNNGVEEDFAGISLSYAPQGMWHDVSETNTINDVGWGVVEVVPEPGGWCLAASLVFFLTIYRRMKCSSGASKNARV